MSRISRQALVIAVKKVQAMSVKEKEQLAGEVFQKQPHVLASCLVQLQGFTPKVGQNSADVDTCANNAACAALVGPASADIFPAWLLAWPRALFRRSAIVFTNLTPWSMASEFCRIPPAATILWVAKGQAKIYF
jgi:hypothetical protein